jgi:hypothetical protein
MGGLLALAVGIESFGQIAEGGGLLGCGGIGIDDQQTLTRITGALTRTPAQRQTMVTGRQRCAA